MELQLIYKFKNRFLDLAVIVVALVVASNIYKQQAKKIISLKESNQAELKRNQALGQISELENKITPYQGRLVRKDPSSVINVISDLAKESGVDIQAIRPEREERLAYYLRSPFHLEINAKTYHDLGRFISSLESYPEIYMEVVHINVAPDTQEKNLRVNLIADNVAVADK